METHVDEPLSCVAEETETKMDTLASESLTKVVEMYERKERQIEDLKNEIELLEFKVDCLEHQLRGITRDNAELHHEADRNRASFTNLQVAVSVIVFAYGWLYGSYFCPA